MKVLLIGGTGNISSYVSKSLLEKGIDLYLLNRGNNDLGLPGVTHIKGDMRNRKEISELLSNKKFDVVVDWIAFTVDHVEFDYELFKDKVKQYLFISSASVYQKPPSTPYITESTPLKNPYWQYSRDKIACEDFLIKKYRENDFPMTIVRPSHTYATILPIISPGHANYAFIDRIKKGKEVFLHGDGTTLWTLTHAEDFARGFCGLVGNIHSIGHAFHITSDEILTWNQIYEILADTLGVKLNIVYIPSEFLNRCNSQLGSSLLGDKAYSMIFDNSKIKRFVPEYKAVIPFSEGIKRVYGWFEADPTRKIIDESINEEMDRIISLYKRNEG
jgi:nucleoside-diphosphate-sugar epimerase